MALKDLKPGQGKVDLTLEVIEKGNVREFQKFGRPGRVATAIVKDESGTLNFTLWNDDIDKVNAGDKIQLKNGYVGEWQGEAQLSTGKFGAIEVLSKGPAEKAKKVVNVSEGEQPSGYVQGDGIKVDEEEVSFDDEDPTY